VRTLSYLTVKDVLRAPAEYDHALEVRAIGPAIVLVLEKDAPLRMEIMSSTEAEFNALVDELQANEKWGEILQLWDAIRAEEEGVCEADFWRREDRHVARLRSGRRVTETRVAES
jgi:hypothetical protein